MKSSEDYKPELGFGLLLVGKPKTGKTETMLQFPNVYVADCDNNLMGPIRHLRQTQPNLRFKYDTINIDDEGNTVPKELRWSRLIDCMKTAAADPEVTTLVADGLSSMNDYLCDHILNNKDAGKDKDRMTISDWIPFKSLLTRFITTFRSVSGKYFILTSHEMWEKDEASGILFCKPWVQSRLQDNIGGYFSDVWLTEAEAIGEKVQFTIRAWPDPRRPQVGNSLGLPIKPFVFNWERLEPFMKTGLFKK